MSTMQVAIRATNQQSFTVDTQPSETIGQLKDKIHTDHGHSPETQKLIYSGRILTDATTIESCAIKENEFIILMLSKARPAPSASTAAATSSTSAAASSYVASRPTATASACSSNLLAGSSSPARPAGTASAFSSGLLAGASTPAARPTASSSLLTGALTPAARPTAMAPALSSFPAPNTQAASASAGSSGGSTQNSFLLGAGVQDAIANIEAMGFTREQVEKAMRASFNNPERAVEYLTNGIPPHLEREAAGSSALTSTSQQSIPSSSNGDMEAIARDPAMLRQMMEQLRSNPAMMQHLIERLSEDHPEMADTLRENPDMLFQQLASAQGEASEEGSTTIWVTQEENQALGRLEALGFNQQQAIKAFIAADKNEDQAANLLFDGIFGEGRPGDDDDQNDHAQPAASASTSNPATQQPAEQEASSSTAPPATVATRSALSNLLQREEQSGGAGGRTAEILGQDGSMSIRQMREHLMSNPEMRESFAQSLSEEHPELATMLRDNPDMFFRMMESAEGRRVCVEVTPAEKESIDQLESFGFTRSQALQAFFAADKNQELAANLLFDGAFSE